MTLQQITKISIGILLIIIGLVFNGLAFMAINSLEKAIFYANLSILSGESITTFIRPIAGILSGGYLKIVDTKYVYLMIAAGWAFIWLGSQIIIFTKSKIPLKFMLSKKYWSVIDWEFIHKRKYKESDIAWVGSKKKPKRQKSGKNAKG